LFHLLGALYPSEFLRFPQFVSKLGELASVRGLGLLVQHLAGVTQAADLDSRLFEILISARQALRGLTRFDIIATARDSAG
jgi:hypothetical protein